jgi:hypothetical protein
LSCEVPAKQQWCSIRETVFGFTTTRFSFHTSSDRKLKLIGAPIITVTGKTYWDVGHAAMQAQTILAYEMNRQPLPVLIGKRA